jgi:hypothetical protein
VGFLMHLDQRIHNKEFIIRIIAHMATGNYYIYEPTAVLLIRDVYPGS